MRLVANVTVVYSKRDNCRIRRKIRTTDRVWGQGNTFSEVLFQEKCRGHLQLSQQERRNMADKNYNWNYSEL